MLNGSKEKKFTFLYGSSERHKKIGKTQKTQEPEIIVYFL